MTEYDEFDLGPIGTIEKYSELILWERTVQIALKDFCMDGCTVLDIGANLGGVSIALSRMVGKTGMVYAFECNPRLAEWCRRTIEVNNAENVVLDERAVYSQTDMSIEFFCEPSYYGHGSSLIERQADSVGVAVKTISIDDFCSEKQINPTAIKIDVEGAEYDVLVGAEKTLQEVQPVVVYEDIGNVRAKRDPIDILVRNGYRLYDAALYEHVDRSFYDERKGVANVLAIPPRLQKKYSYQKLHLCTKIGRATIKLWPGRYVLECDLASESTEIGWIKLTNITSGQVECVYETRVNWLKHHTSSSLVADVKEAALYEVSVGSDNDISDLRLDKIRVYELDNIISGSQIEDRISSVEQSIFEVLQKLNGSG
ncbi:hypothetical protein GCM10011316_20860 [Roseibium aquae]|uniref:Methyltransferase FkbM domain-containing protein n=1 Tax=Roseibium aquae TaxID=1323746 RepID=A0A916X2B1_9HYPH|nr:FkbM family methyltransferase [Roseibium aquae]GGB48546.1 hypothetical protein GCM10011316_20860 [Roseibium aquae]